MLEFYQAYANYHDLMRLTEELIVFVAQEVNGTTITNFNGIEIDLSKWTKLLHARSHHQVLAAIGTAQKPESTSFASHDSDCRA